MGESIWIVWWMSWLVSARDVTRFWNFTERLCSSHKTSKLVYLLHQSKVEPSSLADSKWCTNTKHILQFIFDSSETAGHPSYCKRLILRICLFRELVVNWIKLWKVKPRNDYSLPLLTTRHSPQTGNGEWEGNPVSISPWVHSWAFVTPFFSLRFMMGRCGDLTYPQK